MNLRGQLHAALNSFGSSLLTEREAQVIKLVLHGHSTKTLAENCPSPWRRSSFTANTPTPSWR